jgi:uroporphyrinogen-III synthase
MPTVLLTRPQARSKGEDELHRVLAAAGITVRELPMLRFEMVRETGELDAALARAAQGEYEYILLASPTAVFFFHDRAKELELVDALRAQGRFGTVGHATAEALSNLGFRVELPIPTHGGAHELMALLSSEGLAGKAMLLLQSQIGLDLLEHALRELGARPERVTLYHTKGPSLGDSARLLHLLESPTPPDVIAFFSPSSVSYFVRSLAEMASGMLRKLPALACIGETTAKAVEESLHRRPEIVARKADQESLANDIVTYLRLQNQRN